MYRGINYDYLEEGELIQFFGVHVLAWERDIRPLGIKPTIAFVKDDSLEKINADLLEAGNFILENLQHYMTDNQIFIIAMENLKQAIARAEGKS